MMIATNSEVRFDAEEWGLLGNALNEVLNGFKVADFERTIGAKRCEAERILAKLHTLADTQDATMSLPEARAARNALIETIRQLGVEEFDIRTGYDFERGKAILANIDRFV